MHAVQVVEEACSIKDSEYRALVATVDPAHCKWNPPMHAALAEIQITMRPVRKMEIGFEVFFEGEWIPLSELDDDEGGSESAAEILEPNEALTNDIINEAKIRIWLRFAGYGVL